MLHRPRRNRKSPAIRALVQETRLHPADLIYPLFLREGDNIEEPIPSMPGIYRYSLDKILKQVEKCLDSGIQAIALFPVIEKGKKDVQGSEALNPKSVLIKAISTIKTKFPEMCVIADVALDPFTSHGHDGIIDEVGNILNDETVEILAKMALVQAEAGVDMVAPSDMMDGRVKALREALDKANFSQVSIHAYTAKYASCLYAPFRDALQSTPIGNKKTYQMNPANSREAELEAILDEKEGADILMIKPASFYLDVIAKLRALTPLPISAFQVSGEYSMIIAAHKQGWLDAEAAFHESLLAIKRAGADMIFTYAALTIAPLLK